MVGSLMLLRVGAVVVCSVQSVSRCPAAVPLSVLFVPLPSRRQPCYRTAIIRFSERAAGRNGCCAAADGVWGAGKVAVMIAARLARLVLSAGMFGFGSARTEHTPGSGAAQLTTHNPQNK